MVVVALVLMGLISYTYLPVQQLPNVTPAFVAVVVSYPGASPEEVQQQVTLPLENAISGVAGIQQMNGLSADGISRISIQFANGVDVNTAANDVAEFVDRVQSRLPSGINTPTIFKADPNASPILEFAMYGGPQSTEYDLATNVLQPALQQVPGVASVNVSGGIAPQVNVTVKPQALSAYSVSLNQINTAISNANVSVPGGVTTESGQVRTVRTNAYYQSADELRNLVVASPGNNPVTLGQVADVQMGTAPQDQITTYNGQRAVGLVVTAQSGANVVQVAKAVKAKMAQLQRTLPPGVRVAVNNDQTVYVNESLRAVETDLLFAVILPAIVLLLFLHRIRNVIIVVLAIPTSLISTFLVMYFLGFNLDLISLLALSLLTGILVDDSIVVLENINRHLSMGKNPVRAALDGRIEIGLAAVAITLTDVVVYTPIAFTTGLVGQIFREFGLTIVAATLFSLFVSFTLTPLLASRWLKEPLDEDALGAGAHGGLLMRFGGWWERGFQRIRNAYGRLIGAALRARPLVVLVGVGALALSVAFIPLGWLGTEFTPQVDNSQFSVNIQLPNGTPLATTEAVVTQVDRQIRQLPGVESTFAQAGARGGFFGSANTNSGSIDVDLVPVGQRPPIDTYQQKVNGFARAFPQASIITSLPNPLRFGGGRAIGVVFQGTDVTVLNQLAQQAAQIMQGIPGVVQVRNEASQTVPELSVQLDRPQLASLGISANTVGTAVQTAIAGNTASYLRPNGSTISYPIVVSVEGGPTMTPEQIGQLPLMTASGAVVPLSQVAQVVNDQEPAQLNDQNRELQVTVSASTFGVPLGQAVSEIRQAVTRQLVLPPGYSYTFSGAVQQQQQVFAPLESAFALSVVLVYMLASALYESFLYPLAVLLGLPLATVGAFGALTVTRNTLNLYSFMGMIMLVGLVAKNAILLVDYTNTLRSRGYARNEALAEAGRTRLRPIVMTTCTMVFAMLPLAIKIGAGSEERSPMATVLMGGLITSTLLTLVFIPVVYSYLDDLGELLKRHGLSRGHRWAADAELEAELGGAVPSPAGAAVAAAANAQPADGSPRERARAARQPAGADAGD